MRRCSSSASSVPSSMWTALAWKLQLFDQRLMLAVQSALARGQAFLEGLVAFGAEDAAEYIASLVGFRRKKFAEIALGDHDDAGELLAVDAEDADDGIADAFRTGDDRPVGHGERGVGVDLGHSFSPPALAFLRGPARYGVDAAAVFEFKLDARLEGRRGEVAAQRFRVAIFAARFSEQRVRDGVEYGGLACARVARDQIDAVASQFGEIYLGRARIRAERAHGQMDRPHRSSSLSSSASRTVSYWLAVRPAPFCS